MGQSTGVSRAELKGIGIIRAVSNVRVLQTEKGWLRYWFGEEVVSCPTMLSAAWCGAAKARTPHFKNFEGPKAMLQAISSSAGPQKHPDMVLACGTCISNGALRGDSYALLLPSSLTYKMEELRGRGGSSMGKRSSGGNAEMKSFL